MRMITHVVGPIATNCYIIADGKGAAAVIDPGAEPEQIEQLLKSNNLDLQNIILTHGHFDHFGALKGLKERYPSVPVAIGAEDVPMLETAADNAAVLRYADPADYMGLTCDIKLGDGDHIKVGDLDLTIYSTPGHSRGGVSIECEDALFTGDTLFAGDVGRTDLEGGDYLAILRSVKQLAALEGDRRVYPGHGISTTLEHEREENGYIRSDDV